MKKPSVLSLFIFALIALVSCSDVKRSPGRDYMPDMRYSRAYETYDSHENLKDRGINYTAIPVAGTIKRGETFPFSIPKDQEGDSTNYVAAKQVLNPLPPLDTIMFKETERMYLIHCGICHGTNLDGNGPLYNGGNGPYPAAPKNLIADPVIVNMPEGQMFYSVTYGKGAMGPYGSQLTTSQRWRIVNYVKARQKGITTGAGASPNEVSGPIGPGNPNDAQSTTRGGGNTGGRNLNVTADTTGVKR
ncbi:MAG: cytochrome c [Chitinophagaceae bacterium]